MDQIELARCSFNPEVTVRMRGVMEKCTYCVQRIQSGKQQARSKTATVADGEIQDRMPADLPDQRDLLRQPEGPGVSEVAKMHKHQRSYGILDIKNARPRTRYMAKITNPAHAEDAQHDSHDSHGGGDHH